MSWVAPFPTTREAAKTSTLLSAKIINMNRTIWQAKFTYSHLWKVFEKETKTIKDQGKEIVRSNAPIKNLTIILKKIVRQLKNRKNYWSI